MGVCLGAQLLAHSTGTKIVPLLNSKTKLPLTEIGWSEIKLVDKCSKDLLATQDNDSIYALNWHSDRILLNSSANLLASSKICGEQMFRVGTKSFGLQFHIEDDDVKRWLLEDRDYIIKGLGSSVVIGSLLFFKSFALKLSSPAISSVEYQLLYQTKYFSGPYLSRA